jgi:uncharacterized protein (DUF1499 family)
MTILKSASHRRAKARWLAVATGVVAVIFFTSMHPMNNASTGPALDDPLLRTRIYHATPIEIEATVNDIVPRLRTYGRKWRLISSRPTSQVATQGASIRIRCEVPVLVFTDDLEVLLGECFVDEVPGYTSVDVISRSRVGRSDLGENRRHIIQLLHALDARMNKVLPGEQL